MSEVAEQLQLAIALMVRQARAAHTPDGLTLSQISVLKRLDRDGVLTATELAKSERIRPQSVIATVNSLQAGGYVERTPHATDGRRLLIGLTDQGRDFVRKRQAAGHGRLSELMSERLTAEERRVVAAAVPLLRRLAEY